MQGHAFLVWGAIGLLAGWLASFVVGGGGLIRYLVSGLIGSFVGGLVLQQIHRMQAECHGTAMLLTHGPDPGKSCTGDGGHHQLPDAGCAGRCGGLVAVGVKFPGIQMAVGIDEVHACQCSPWLTAPGGQAGRRPW